MLGDAVPAPTFKDGRRFVVNTVRACVRMCSGQKNQRRQFKGVCTEYRWFNKAITERGSKHNKQ